MQSAMEEMKTRLSQQDVKILEQDQKIFQLMKEITEQKPFGPQPKSTGSCPNNVDNTASKKNEKSINS